MGIIKQILKAMKPEETDEDEEVIGPIL